MAKDPAFLFYSGDFLTGSTFMSNEEAGQYIRVLCLLHQHNGRLPKNKIEKVVGKLTDLVLEKLQIDKENNLFNKRLMEETNKRNAFCSSRRRNILNRYKSATSVAHTNLRMENEDEDEDIINSNKSISKIYNNNVSDKDKTDHDNDKEEVFKQWNERMPYKITSITGSRLIHLKERLKEKKFVDEFHTILTKILESDFLSGRKPSKEHPNFRADFDFLVKNGLNYIKILEGKYDNKREVAI